MIWNIIGGLIAASGPAMSVAAMGASAKSTVRFIDSAYEKAVYFSLPPNIRDIYDEEAEYFMTSLEYSPYYRELMRLPKTEYFVAWSDPEMGEYVRLEGMAKQRQDSPEEHQAMLELLEKGERRASYLSSALMPG